MGSLTQRTWRRRGLKLAKMGRQNTKERLKRGTPAFPIQPEGYDPNAPDAKSPKADAKSASGS